MGVVYKIKDEVVAYILAQRQANPRLSCRELAEQVASQFQVHVSKSSVHEVLKEANVPSPRGRKPNKEGSKIPAEKKLQIQASLPKEKIVAVEVPIVLTPVVEPAKEIPAQEKKKEILVEEVKPVELDRVVWENEIEQEKAGEVFLKAAQADLYLKEINQDDAAGLEWGYVTTQLAAIKITLADANVFFIDARMQRPWSNLAEIKNLGAPINHLAAAAADELFNNVKPLVINSLGENSVNAMAYDFLGFMMGLEVKAAVDISLVDAAGKSYIEYHKPLAYNRLLTIGIPKNAPEVAFLAQLPPEKIQKCYSYKLMQELCWLEASWESPLKDNKGKPVVFKIILIKADSPEENRVILSNRWQEATAVLVEEYLLRHPQEEAAFKGEPSYPQGVYDFQERLKQRALGVFFDGASLEVLEESLNLKAKVKNSPQISNITFTPATTYAHTAALQQACHIVNNLALNDDANRLIRLNFSSENVVK